MRSVRSATCTSGEPVSPSCCASFLMVSDFRLAAKLMLSLCQVTLFLMRKDALGPFDCQPVVEDAQGHEPPLADLGERGQPPAGSDEALGPGRARGRRQRLAALDPEGVRGLQD